MKISQLLNVISKLVNFLLLCMSNFLLLCIFRSLYSVYCMCVNVCCTAATGCQPNCGYIYIISYHIISDSVTAALVWVRFASKGEKIYLLGTVCSCIRTQNLVP
jgi:hypothetical protein